MEIINSPKRTVGLSIKGVTSQQQMEKSTWLALPTTQILMLQLATAACTRKTGACFWCDNSVAPAVVII